MCGSTKRRTPISVESDNLIRMSEVTATEAARKFADLLDAGRDALHRDESCGGHFREESQTEEGEALRNDDEFCFVGAWEFQGLENEPVLHKEDLKFEEVKLSQRSYK